MPRGVPLLDHRNGAQRARRAQSAHLKGLAASVFAKNPYRIIRTDFPSGIETEITKREFEFDFTFNSKFYFSKIARVALYTSEFDLIWREMENGTVFYAGQSAFRIEYQNKVQRSAEITE